LQSFNLGEHIFNLVCHENGIGLDFETLTYICLNGPALSNLWNNVLDQWSQTRGPHVARERVQFGPPTSGKMKILKKMWSQFVYFLSFLKIYFSSFFLRPARTYFQFHAARKTLWVWDPCLRLSIWINEIFRKLNTNGSSIKHQVTNNFNSDIYKKKTFMVCIGKRVRSNKLSSNMFSVEVSFKILLCC